jgi:membrane protein YqaA with SNARE-associated domain
MINGEYKIVNWKKLNSEKKNSSFFNTLCKIWHNNSSFTTHHSPLKMNFARFISYQFVGEVCRFVVAFNLPKKG